MKTIKTTALAVAIMIACPTISFAQDVHGYMHDGHGWCAYDGYHYGGMHLFWWFLWLVFIFVIFGLFQPVSRKKMKQSVAMEILKKRFASGEITKEQFEEMKKKFS